MKKKIKIFSDSQIIDAICDELKDENIPFDEFVHFDDQLISRELHKNIVENSSGDETEIEEFEERVPNGSEVLEMIDKVKKYFCSREDISHKVFQNLNSLEGDVLRLKRKFPKQKSIPDYFSKIN